MNETVKNEPLQYIPPPASGNQRNEWLKEKLFRLWNSQKICGLCLDNGCNLNLIDMEFVISRHRDSKSLLDILNYIFNDDIENMIYSRLICDNCTEKTIKSYLFIHQTKQLSKIMNNCIVDIDSKVTDVHEQVLESLDSQNANIMIVLENDEEINDYIDDLTATPEIIPSDKPIFTRQIYSKEIEHCGANENEVDTTIGKDLLTSNTFNTEQYTPEAKIERTANITLEKGKIVIQPMETAMGFNLIPSFTMYKCNQCTEIFTTLRSLKEHEKLKHNMHIYQCNLCHKSYNTQQYLSLHYKSHSKARCKLCQTIMDEDELFTHLKQKHGHLVYDCKFCNLVYYTQEALDTHFKAIHLINDMSSKSQCPMCLKDVEDLKKHKCKFGCSECFNMPCIHHKFLVAYREKVLNHKTKVYCIEIDCDYVTHRKEYLITHANREHLDHHPFTCNDCGMQFYTKMSLKTHIDQYHIDNLCIYCDTDFKNRNILREHRKACKNITREFCCEKCPASFDMKEDAVNHVRLKHLNEGYACNSCSKRFLDEEALNEHFVAAHNHIQFKKRRRNIQCTLCNIKFNSVKELQQHEELHGSDAVFPCKSCPKEFRSLKKLYSHQQRHYDRIQCETCKKRVIAAYYPQHVVRCPYRRSSEFMYICETCGKSFHTPSLLRLHLKSHENVDCSICLKKVKASNLEKHMAAHDGTSVSRLYPNKLKLACNICGHRVRKACDLDAHMNRFHLKIKPYICHICKKSFCGKMRLNEHLVRHTTENECYCSICAKKFANKVCLKMHLRIHTGENPYSCDICGEKFRSSSIMKTHRLKKHLEKTVSCPACDNMFHIVREMRHHFKVVHWKYKDRPFNYKEAVPKEYYHLFEDRRLPQIESDNFVPPFNIVQPKE